MHVYTSSILRLLLLSALATTIARSQVTLRPGDVSLIEKLLVQHDVGHLVNRPHVVVCLRHGSCKSCIDYVDSLLLKCSIPAVVSVCASNTARTFGLSRHDIVRIHDNECVANKLSIAQPLSSLLVFSKGSGYTWYPIEPASLGIIRRALGKHQR